MILSPAVVSGAQFRRQRKKPSKELYNAGRRVVETFQGLGGCRWTWLSVFRASLGGGPLHLIPEDPPVSTTKTVSISSNEARGFVECRELALVWP